MAMREPLQAEEAAQQTLSLDWLSSRADTVSWIESGPTSGRKVLMSWSSAAGVRAVATGVGNSLHAYGGRPYVIADTGTIVTREDDGQIWNLDTNTQLTNSLHPQGDLAADAGRVCGVRETPAGDELIVIELRAAEEARSADGPPAVTEVGVDVAHRAPFIAAPRLRGARLAWTQWSADVMPWDSAEVMVAWYRPGQPLSDVQRVAGGEQEAAHQPWWGPEGALYFLSDRTGWWNLYRWRPGGVDEVAPMEAECGDALWESGYASYTGLPDGRIALIAQNGPVHRIVLVASPGRRPVASGAGSGTELRSGLTSVKPFLAATTDGLAVIGGAPDRGAHVALLSTDATTPTRIVRDAAARRPPSSEPELVSIDSDGEPITVVFRPGVAAAASPLIVRAHPGPTHHSKLRLDGEAEFFTSRGFAVADVDYRGSTGYGRRFRTALNGRWGELDVEDCIAAARALVAAGRARADAVFISGASAGGYTALRAVSREDTPFALAVARSAIVAPTRWTRTAPRFQRAHAATLAHAAADVNPARVCRPVVLIHGRDDAIAPVVDVDGLAATLDERGLLLEYLQLPDVGHSLPSTALAAALSSEIAAYEAYLSRMPG